MKLTQTRLLEIENIPVVKHSCKISNNIGSKENKRNYENNKKRTDYLKKYEELNKDRIRERKKIYYEANKKRLSDQRTEYKRLNKEKIKIYNKTLENSFCSTKSYLHKLPITDNAKLVNSIITVLCKNVANDSLQC